MKCAEVRKFVRLYLDSELDAKNSFEVEQHLESCVECAGLFEADTNGFFSAKCCCIVVRPQIQASPLSFAPVFSYSPSGVTVRRDAPSIFPSTDESM